MTGDGLRATGVSVRVNGQVLVDSVDIDVLPGRLTALIGPNGAGKTTLIHALAGTARPSEGDIRWNSRDWLAEPRRSRARVAALVEQDATAELPMTVQTVVALGRTPHGSLFGGGTGDNAVVRSALRRVGIEDFATRQFGTLSGGERQRVHLARALAQEPLLLLLDEPTNHLDVHAQLGTLRLVQELARDNGVAALAALHDLNLAAAYADDIVVLEHGRVVARGTPWDVLTAELLRRLYRVEAMVLEHPVTGRPLIAYLPALPGVSGF